MDFADLDFAVDVLIAVDARVVKGRSMRSSLRWGCQLALAGLLGVLLLPSVTAAQGDGPRVYLLAPVGINALSLTYMDMASNMNFAGNILIQDVDFESDVGALNYNHFFSLGGRFAEIWVTPIWGTVRGSLEVGDDPPPIIPFPPGTNLDIPSESGFADPYVAMRVGLLGAPPLKPEEFMQHKQGFKEPQKVDTSVAVLEGRGETIELVLKEKTQYKNFTVELELILDGSTYRAGQGDTIEIRGRKFEVTIDRKTEAVSIRNLSSGRKITVPTQL